MAEKIDEMRKSQGSIQQGCWLLPLHNPPTVLISEYGQWWSDWLQWDQSQFYTECSEYAAVVSQAENITPFLGSDTGHGNRALGIGLWEPGFEEQ